MTPYDLHVQVDAAAGQVTVAWYAQSAIYAGGQRTWTLALHALTALVPASFTITLEPLLAAVANNEVEPGQVTSADDVAAAPDPLHQPVSALAERTLGGGAHSHLGPQHGQPGLPARAGAADERGPPAAAPGPGLLRRAGRRCAHFYRQGDPLPAPAREPHPAGLARRSGRGLLRWLHGYTRASIVPPVTVVAGIDTIEVTGFGILNMGHGYFASAAPVIEDMREAIVERKRAGERSIPRRSGDYFSIDVRGWQSNDAADEV